MNLNDLVTSLEDSKRLQEAGIDFPDSCFVWAREMLIKGWSEPRPRLRKKEESGILVRLDLGIIAPAPTLQEMLERMPKGIRKNGQRYKLMYYPKLGGVYYTNGEIETEDDLIAHYTVEMLLYLKENKYI